MIIKMDIFKDGVMVESYVVPDSSWIQSRLLGSQYAYPVLNKEVTYKGDKGVVKCSPVDPVPEIPEQLLELVNSKDKQYGRNGHEWLGLSRETQGGTETDRIREYVNNAVFYGDNPVLIDEETLRKLKEGL